VSKTKLGVEIKRNKAQLPPTNPRDAALHARRAVGPTQSHEHEGGSVVPGLRDDVVNC